MIYTFENISTSKFSINGRTLWKTFLPVFIDDDHILIYNIYDCKCPLIRSTKVSDIEVDGVVYPNATDLINNIHEVLFSRAVGGDIDNEQIELNRLAIIQLQSDVSDLNDKFGDYYTKGEVDDMFSGLPDPGESVVSGEVDGDTIRFYNDQGQEVFTVDATAFNSQGTLLSFEDGILQLKNSSGEVLSSVEVKAKEPYYDTSEYQEGIENDLSDLILTTPFALVQTIEEKFYFVSASGNLEKFQNSRIYLLDSEEYFDLGEPDISTSGFSAWEIATSGEFIQGSGYRFNWWLKESGKGKVKYVGNYPTLADLEQYNPIANDGDTGIVNTEFGDLVYTWTNGGWGAPYNRAEQQIDYLVASDLPGHIQNSINF